MREPELTDDNPWVIEFRNGLYLYSLEADHSVSIEQARRFPTMRDVDDFVTRHEWILFNGGMPVEICAKCSRHVDYRGQVHCKDRVCEPPLSKATAEGDAVPFNPRGRKVVIK